MLFPNTKRHQCLPALFFAWWGRQNYLSSLYGFALGVPRNVKFPKSNPPGYTRWYFPQTCPSGWAWTWLNRSLGYCKGKPLSGNVYMSKTTKKWQNAPKGKPPIRNCMRSRRFQSLSFWLRPFTILLCWFWNGEIEILSIAQKIQKKRIKNVVFGAPVNLGPGTKSTSMLVQILGLIYFQSSYDDMVCGNRCAIIGNPFSCCGTRPNCYLDNSVALGKRVHMSEQGRVFLPIFSRFGS